MGGCPVRYEGSWTVILEDMGAIHRYGLHHSYEPRTPMRVVTLIPNSFEQAHAMIREHQSTEMPIKMSTAGIKTIYRSPKYKYFENILCEIFDC